MNDDDQLAHRLRLTPRGRLALSAAGWIVSRLLPSGDDTADTEQTEEDQK